MMKENNIYIITRVLGGDKKDVIGYSEHVNEAKMFCDNRELSSGDKYEYELLPNIRTLYNSRPRYITIKANYITTKDYVGVDSVCLADITEYLNESDNPIWPTWNNMLTHFYFPMEIDRNSSKEDILRKAKIEAENLFDNKYKEDKTFEGLVNQQLLVNEGIIESYIG